MPDESDRPLGASRRFSVPNTINYFLPTTYWDVSGSYYYMRWYYMPILVMTHKGFGYKTVIATGSTADEFNKSFGDPDNAGFFFFGHGSYYNGLVFNNSWISGDAATPYDVKDHIQHKLTIVGIYACWGGHTWTDVNEKQRSFRDFVAHGGLFFGLDKRINMLDMPLPPMEKIP